MGWLVGCIYLLRPELTLIPQLLGLGEGCIGIIVLALYNESKALVEPVFCGLLTLGRRHRYQQNNENWVDQSHKIEEVFKEDMFIELDVSSLN